MSNVIENVGLQYNRLMLSKEPAVIQPDSGRSL